MAGIDEQVLDRGLADQWHVVGAHGAKTGVDIELGFVQVSLGEELLGVIHEPRDALRIGFVVETCKVSAARDTNRAVPKRRHQRISTRINIAFQLWQILARPWSS